MKTTISDINLYYAKSNISEPIADSTHEISDIAFYVLEVTTKQGIKGQGYLLAFHYSPNAIEGALKDIRNFALPKEYSVHETVQLTKDYEIETEYFGNLGLQKWTLAALNVAMWDAWGKTLGQPIWKLLGGSNRPIPVYGSGGWISYTTQELIEEVMNYKSRGFKAVKIKVGSPSVEQDLERLAKVREAVGEDINIMMDANQGMDVATSLELSREAAKIGIHWFEEPISNTDFAGYETLRNKAGILLAMGEREYDFNALKSLISRNALDLWQPDLIRIGGVEEWRKSASLANIYNIPVLPHYYKDYDVPLLATISNGYAAESFDWIDGIIDNPMKIENGHAILRQEPGWGFSFKEEHLKEIKY